MNFTKHLKDVMAILALASQDFPISRPRPRRGFVLVERKGEYLIGHESDLIYEREKAVLLGFTASESRKSDIKPGRQGFG